MLAAVCGVTLSLFAAGNSTRAELQSPVGLWSCVLYERDTADSDYVLMRFDPDGATYFARRSGDEFRIWAPVSSWTVRRGALSFRDSRVEREFEADLERSGLGGTWEAEHAAGGWWCARLDDAYADLRGVQTIEADDVMPPLIVRGASTPYYPLGAIRQARDGHAAVCFLVDSTGTITDPEFIELSDEIFRETTLRAVLASSYQGWGGEPSVRPGCRTYEFELEPVD